MEQLVVKGVKDFSKDLSGNNLAINVEAAKIVKLQNTIEIDASIVAFRSAFLWA